jgi:hypothetical protein
VEESCGQDNSTAPRVNGFSDAGFFHTGEAYVLDASRSLDRWYLKQQQQQQAASRRAAALRTVVHAHIGVASIVVSFPRVEECENVQQLTVFATGW